MLTGPRISERTRGWLPFMAAALTLIGAGEALPRDLDLIEGAHELVLTDLILPPDATGRITFAPCRGCASVGLSLSAQTACFVDGQRQEFARFAESVKRLRVSGASGTAFVGLFYEIGSSRVTRIEVVTR